MTRLGSGLLALWLSSLAPAAELPAGDPAVPLRVPLNFRVNAYAQGIGHLQGVAVLPSGDVLSFGAADGGAGRVVLLRDPAASGQATERTTVFEGPDPVVGAGGDGAQLYVATPRAVLRCTVRRRPRPNPGCAVLAHPQGDRVLVDFSSSPRAATLYVLDRPAGEAGAAPQPGVLSRLLALRPDGVISAILATDVPDGVRLAVDGADGSAWLVTAEAAGIRAWQAGPAAIDSSSPAPLAAPLAGVALYRHEQFPRDYRGGLFVAPAPPSATAVGGEVRFLRSEAGAPAAMPADFLAGLAPRPDVPTAGRTAQSLAVGTDGTLIVADPGRDTLWRVRFKCAACTPDPVVPARRPVRSEPRR